MKFDVVITGGGLSGLSCGLALVSKGRSCAIISSGQNAMHFSSGCLNVLNFDARGAAVQDPFAAMETLPVDHPYRKIGGASFVKDAMERFRKIASDSGVRISGGENGFNSFRITPLGKIVPAFASIDEVSLLSSEDLEALKGRKLLIAGIEDYLDFDAGFIAAGLERAGAECRIVAVSTQATRRLRQNPTEMRATNIARALSDPAALDEFIQTVNGLVSHEDIIVLPAVFHLGDSAAALNSKAKFAKTVICVGTMPPSVPGIRMQSELKRRFEALGGVFLASDTVVGGIFDGARLSAVRSSNLEDELLEADNFVLASGSFFSKGLDAGPGAIRETALSLDCNFRENRDDWYQRDFFAHQEYLGFGVATNERLQCLKDGLLVENLYAAGSVLGGYNPLEEGSGAAVAICTGLFVADRIEERF